MAGRFIGYARVSTVDQEMDGQVEDLRAAGCVVILEEKASGGDAGRPVLAKLLKGMVRGETLVVVRLDRLARSVVHLLAVIEDLRKRGCFFRSLRDPVDTSTAQGMFTLQVLGAVAQLERSLIAERTRVGLRVARSQGRVGGNPGLRSRDADEIAKVQASRSATLTGRVVDGSKAWLPTVQRLRPTTTWGDVARALNEDGGGWSVERLRRSVRLLVREGLASELLLGRAMPASNSERLVGLVRGMLLSGPDRTFTEIAAMLEKMGERTPRGGTRWHASSVRHLLDRSGSVPSPRRLPRAREVDRSGGNRV
jgi:DNA invertase Pin-like site-specific DNA recombinase